MRKGNVWIAGILITTMVLAGCKGQTASEDTAVTEAVVTEAAESTPEPEEGDLSGDAEETEAAVSGETEEESPAGDEIDIGAVYETGYLTVALEEAETDDAGNCICRFHIDSKYEQPAVCYTNYVGVNGWDFSIDKWYYEELDEQGSSDWELVFSAEELEKYQIEKFEEIRLILTLGSEDELTDIDKCGFTFYPGEDAADPEKTDVLLDEVKGLTPVYADEDTEIWLTRNSTREGNVVLDGILLNHTENYLSIAVEGAAVGEAEAAVSGDAIIFPEAAGRFFLSFRDDRINSELFRDARDLRFTLAASNYFDYEELWTQDIQVPLPEGFADSFSMDPGASGAAWIPYGMSGYTGPGAEGEDPYSGEVAGIQFMDIIAEVPMSMFNQNEALSASATAFYMADAYLLAVVDSSGSEGSAYSSGADAFGAYVASKVSPGAEYSVRETQTAGQSAVIVDIRDADTAYGELDFSITAFYYNGVFYGFGAGVFDDACDQSQMFDRMLSSIRPV